jgi:hypothetical protein
MANTDRIYGFAPAMNLYGGTNSHVLWEVQIKSNHLFAQGDAVYASVGYARNAVTGDKAVLGVVASKTYAHSAGGGTRICSATTSVWPASTICPSKP